MIDAWIQHPTHAMLTAPMFASLRRWLGVTDDAIPPELSEALTLGAVQAAGLDLALLTAWIGPDGPLISNDAVAAMVARHPDQLVGIGCVDLRFPMKAVGEVRRCVEELGFKGIRILPWLWDLPPDDRRYYPVYAACVDLGIPFCTQVGHTGPLMPSEWGRPIPYLDRVAYEFPELTIVGGHVGYPWTEEMVSLTRKYDNVWMDTSAWKVTRFPEPLKQLLRSDRHKVLFGSNWPMLAPQAALKGLDELGLSDTSRQRFLEGNARTVFRLP